MRNRRSVGRQHPVVCVQLGILLDLAHIPKDQHIALLIVVDKLLHGGLQVLRRLLFAMLVPPSFELEKIGSYFIVQNLVAKEIVN